jgi:gluconolactonase
MQELKLELVAEGLRFPEGPVAMADGSVVLVEIAAKRITRVAPDGGKTTVAEPGGGPNGAAIGPDGALYVCNNGERFTYAELDGQLIPSHPPAHFEGGAIQRVDLASGRAETLYTECDGRRLIAPNDLVFAPDGGFWFSDYGYSDAEGTRHGGLYWARADGSAIRRAATLPSPNGVGLSPDGRTVYAADTMTGRLWAMEIAGEGQVAPGPMAVMPGRCVATMPGYQLFDSLAVEADGRVCVATLINGAITAIAPDGSFEQYEVPDLLPTNICFGGPDMRDAWITASGTGRLYRTRWPRPGLKLAFNA